MASAKLARSPADHLASDRRAALRLAQEAGKRRTERLLKRAQRDLERRLSKVRPGAEGSFTAVQARATLMQVRRTLAELAGGLRDVLVDQAGEVAGESAGAVLGHLAAMEEHRRGVTAPLPIDAARMMDRAAKGARASVLRRIASDEGHRGRPGILARYGKAQVGHFERILQVGMVARKSWVEMREDLQEASPFLKQAPAFWAHRIVRTEIMKSHNASAHETIAAAAEEIDGMLKVWVETFDERTGADSFSQHGQLRRPDEAFESWYGAVDYPPNRPNDRAVVVAHRMSWPLPKSFAWRSPGEILQRWRAEGRKGAPPDRPLMTTVPLDQIGAARGRRALPDGGDEG